MQAIRRLLSASLVCVLCLLLPACNPGVISDQSLKDRLARNRADYDELVRLYESLPDDHIDIGINAKIPPRSSIDPATWKKIQDLLAKLKLTSVSHMPGEVVIWLTDSPWWDYAFVYSATPPPNTENTPVPPGGLVPSLKEKTKPGTPYGVYYMHLDGNWYASMNEGTGIFD